jgi:hypothetical protein
MKYQKNIMMFGYLISIKEGMDELVAEIKRWFKIKLKKWKKISLIERTLIKYAKATN